MVEIVNTPLVQVLRVLYMAACVAGFFYQFILFVRIYANYPTVTNVFVKTTEGLVFPSLTICHKNRVRRNCTKIGKKGANLEDCIWEEVNRTNSVTPMQMFDILEKFGSDKANLIINCRFYETQSHQTVNNSVNCSDTWHEALIFTPSKFGPCYTLNSTKNLENVTYVYDYKADIFLDLHAKATDKDYEAVIAAHTPDTLPDTWYQHTVNIRPGIYYDIQVSQSLISRLKSPYDTKCTDYSPVSDKFPGFYMATDNMCSDLCRQVELKETCNCLHRDMSLSYSDNTSLCQSSRELLCAEITNNFTEGPCKLKCGVPCNRTAYGLTVVPYQPWPLLQQDIIELCEILANTSGHNSTIKKNKILRECNDSRRYTKLSIVFETEEYTQIVYREQYLATEFISTVGGHLGIWIGISLMACYDKFIYIYSYILDHIKSQQFMRKPKKRKRMTEKPPTQSKPLKAKEQVNYNIEEQNATTGLTPPYRPFSSRSIQTILSGGIGKRVLRPRETKVYDLTY